jgi:hypothetical protein
MGGHHALDFIVIIPSDVRTSRIICLLALKILLIYIYLLDHSIWIDDSIWIDADLVAIQIMSHQAFADTDLGGRFLDLFDSLKWLFIWAINLCPGSYLMFLKKETMAHDSVKKIALNRATYAFKSRFREPYNSCLISLVLDIQ